MAWFMHVPIPTNTMATRPRLSTPYGKSCPPTSQRMENGGWTMERMENGGWTMERMRMQKMENGEEGGRGEL